MLQDRIQGPGVAQALRWALRHGDVELRATAVAVAACLELPELAVEVRKTSLVDPALGAEQARWLKLGREASLQLLGLPPNTRTLGAQRKTPRFDADWLLLHSLTTPTPAGPLPDSLPPGVDEALRYTPLGVPLVWISPVESWVGPPERLLRVIPRGGSWVFARCLSAPEAGCLGLTRRPRRDDLVAALDEHPELRLLKSSEWERLARGADGRPFPGGLVAGDPGPSPYGAAELELAQWVQEGAKGVGPTWALHHPENAGIRLALRSSAG